MNLRSRLAIVAAKLTSKLIRLCHMGSGMSLPGAVASRIDPHILSVLSAMVREKIIVVTGTNGKTTVNSLLRQALLHEGKSVVSNETGANMPNGIVSAFVLHADCLGRFRADFACIEVDEIAASSVLGQLRPDCIMVTNIFRDQLDRFGEIDILTEKLCQAISQVPKAVLTINCDDPLLGALARRCPNPLVTCGVSEPAFHPPADSLVREGVFCPFCGEKLRYDLFHYGHLGLYRCPGCGWRRPQPDYAAVQIRLGTPQSRFQIRTSSRTVPLRVRLEAPYNLYNTLSAYAALQSAGAPTDGFAAASKHFRYENGREEIFFIHKTRVQLYLVKNPVGFQQKLALLAKDPAAKDLLFVINDTPLDGQDISWLWDVDFGCLAASRAALIVTSGSRRLDMALRLKYENIACSEEKSLRTAVFRLTRRKTGRLYILTNYSGLYPIHHMLHTWPHPGGGRRKYSLLP